MRQLITKSYFGTRHSLVMMDKVFDIRLIQEFNGTTTDMPIFEWIENVELVCELCTMDRVKHVMLLRLQDGALAAYRQLSKKRADPEEMTAYVSDAFNVFDQFTARQLQQNETVDEFLANFHHLARLVGEPLSEHWITCVIVSGLPQRIRLLLRASSWIETMTLEQLLTRAHAVVTNDQGQEEPIVAAAQRSQNNIKASPESGPHNRIVCFNYNDQGHVLRDYTSRRQGVKVRC